MSVRKYKISPTLTKKLKYATEHILARFDDKEVSKRDEKALQKYADQRCLSLNKLSADSIEFIREWTDLRDLQINACKIGDYSAVTSAKKLAHLWFNGLREKTPDLSFMSKLVSLETLGIGYVTNLQTVPDLSKCKKLHSLDIWNCKSLTDISTVTRIPNLRNFSILATKIVPSDLEDVLRMSSLEEIFAGFASAKERADFRDMAKQFDVICRS